MPWQANLHKVSKEFLTPFALVVSMPQMCGIEAQRNLVEELVAAQQLKDLF